MNWKHCVVSGVVLGLSGCAAPSVRYYSLDSVPQASAGATLPATAPYGLDLRVAGVPAEVDRIQLVVQDPSRAPAVQVLNQSLWVAPLRDQVQRQLADGVSAQLGVPLVASSPHSLAHAVRSVVVHVTRFDLVWGQAAWLGARWTDRLPGTKSPRICQVALSEAAGAQIASLVSAQQNLLRALSTVIAHPEQPPLPSSGLQVVSKGCTS